MRLITKLAFVGTAGVAVGSYMGNRDGEKQSLTADEFNAMQDQDYIQKALRDLDSQSIAFYRLTSCPYCSMTQALLDYGRLRYHVVGVDPITAYGMPQHSYPLTPQLQFMYDPVRRADPKDKEPMKHGTFLVDSDAIARTLAPVLGLNQSLDSPSIVTSRNWVRETFVRSSYVAMNGSYALAFSSYPGLVPERWNNGFCRMVGAGALCFLAKYMIRPKLEQCESNGFPVDGNSMPDVIIQNAADHFVQNIIPPGKTFHGGDKPDIVDIEMYGLVRTTIAQSAPARLALERSQIDEWRKHMKDYVPVQKTATLLR